MRRALFAIEMPGALVLLSVCSALFACAARAEPAAPSVDVDAWLARRYPATLGEPTASAPPLFASDDGPAPSASTLHEACAGGDPRACFELRGRDAYLDPRGPIVHRGCFGTRMERQGDLDDKKMRSIHAIDGGSAPSR